MVVDGEGNGEGAGRMLTVADAFTGTATLGPTGRAALALLLGGRRTTIEQAPLGDIGDRRHRRHLRTGFIEALADQGVLDRLVDIPLTCLVPGAALLPDAGIGTHECSAPVFTLLARYQVQRWSTLLGLAVGELRSWTKDTRMIAEVVGLAFDRGLAGLAAAHEEATPAGAAVDLAILLHHEQPAPTQTLRGALAELAGPGVPAEVRRAATRLLRMVPTARIHADVLADVLDAAGDPRDVEVFAERSLRLRRRPSFDETAKRIGLSAERVRQLRLRAEGRARAAFAAAPDDTRALVGEVRRWLGTVVPVGVADDVARRLGAGSAHTRIGGLLLWLAGPYQPVPGRYGWLALEPVELVASTTAWLAEDGGVRPVGEIYDELAAEGVRPEFHDDWVAACGGRVVDDMVVHIAGGPAAVAERALFATGRAMTVTEIATLVGPQLIADVRTVLNRNRRFVRVTADAYELAEWGGAAEPAPPASTPPGPTSIDGCWWVRVAVDDEVLRGAVIVPDGLAHLVSQLPRHRRTFTSRYGPVTIIDEDSSPALGSLRHTALACGAQPGDDLWLGFDPTGEVSLRRYDAGEATTPDDTPRAYADRPP